MEKPLNPWQPITNKLELALLGKLIEELNEAGKAAARCIIQGLDGFEPTTYENNTNALLKELADVHACSQMIGNYVKANADRLNQRTEDKINYLSRWHKLLES